MDCRKFEITLISGVDLEDVRRIFKMKVYARVTIGGDPSTEKQTPVDRHGRLNPAWNFTTYYTVGESCIQHYNTMLVIKLYCKRKLGDRYIGEVHQSMKELFDYAEPYGGSAIMTYGIQKGSVKSQGLLNFSYRFGEGVSIEKLLLAENIGIWTTGAV